MGTREKGRRNAVHFAHRGSRIISTVRYRCHQRIMIRNVRSRRKNVRNGLAPSWTVLNVRNGLSPSGTVLNVRNGLAPSGTVLNVRNCLAPS